MVFNSIEFLFFIVAFFLLFFNLKGKGRLGLAFFGFDSGFHAGRFLARKVYRHGTRQYEKEKMAHHEHGDESGFPRLF